MNIISPHSFRRLLMEAVADISENGYASRQAIEAWLRLLQDAAERDLGPPQKIDAEMRSAMDAIYRRLLEGGQIARHVPGVQRFTINMIRPELRAELDRRILASVDLIKLHRDEALDRTLQRFSGWATSIPPGGDPTVDRLEVRERFGKALRQYKFDRRRIAIDQGHKLVANIADIVAADNGAIAAIWHSHWRQAGYDFRPDHKERDLKVYAIRGSWALEQGLMNKGAGYTDEITAPAQEPYCRCNFEYVMSPRRLPAEMLTKKGQRWIKQSEIPKAA